MKNYDEYLCEQAVGVAGGDIHHVINECNAYKVAAHYIAKYPYDSEYVRVHMLTTERVLRAFVNAKRLNPSVTFQNIKDLIEGSAE